MQSELLSLLEGYVIDYLNSPERVASSCGGKMNWLDIVIIVVGVVLGFIGYRLGILKVVALIVGIAVGIVLASHFNSEVADFLSRWIDSPGTAKIAAYGVILGLTVIAAALVTGLLRRLLSLLFLGWVDRVAGLALGVFAAFAIFSAILSAAQDFELLGISDTIAASTLGAFVADKFDVVLRILRLVPNDFGLP